MTASATRPDTAPSTATPRVRRPAPTGGRRRRVRRRTPLVALLIYVSLVLACVVALLPMVVVLFASLKSGAEYAATGAFVPPENWLNLDNYVVAFTQGGMLLAFANTALILVVSLAGSVVLGAMAAYALNRFAFRGRALVVGGFLLAALVPSVTQQVATFQIVAGLGLFNTRVAAIVLFTSTDIIAIYIFMQFMRGIPRELDEAAALDGAGHWRTFWLVIFPLLRPAIATVVIIKGIAIYNEFYIPFLYMPSRELGVLSTSLFRFMGPFGARWEVISAGVIIVIVPTLVAFLGLQRMFYNGFTQGATK